ncbi:MAG: alpha/beta hydrolase [Pseudomonadales bacterium]|nr:MAG: alpha/beta hydrolase [Pseudomonadales bacterium]
MKTNESGNANKVNEPIKHIVLIHGLHQRHWIMKPLALRFEKAGYICHLFNYSSLAEPMETHITRLHSWLAPEVGETPFHMVGHSLGGLVIRQFLHKYPQWLENGRLGRGGLGRVVTLGTPHLGSTTADYAKRLLPIAVGHSYKGALDGSIADLPDGVCLGVIAGNKPQGLGTPVLSYHNRKGELSNEDKANDGTVYVFETRLPKATDHIVMPVTHTGMLIDKAVAENALYFLENGCFQKIDQSI